MAAEIHDGGFAFPQRSIAEIQGIATHSGEFAVGGMSLRDYFAAQALPMAIRQALDLRRDQINPPPFDFKRVADAAYAMADALLHARAVDQGGQ